MNTNNLSQNKTSSLYTYLNYKLYINNDNNNNLILYINCTINLALNVLWEYF